MVSEEDLGGNEKRVRQKGRESKKRMKVCDDEIMGKMLFYMDHENEKERG